MVSFRPRHICAILMRKLTFFVPGMAALCLAACTTAPTRPPDPDVPIDKLVRAASEPKLHGTETHPIYGLAAVADQLHGLDRRCTASSGQLVVVRRVEVTFPSKDSNLFGGRQARLSLPEEIGCKAYAGNLWGARLSYASPRIFASSWTGDVHYYASLQVTFEPGRLLDAADPQSEANRSAALTENARCDARRAEYSVRLRTAPQVGMSVAFGTIIDLRPPLALVQYDRLGQQVKGLQQQWVEISTLSSGTNCP